MILVFTLAALQFASARDIGFDIDGTLVRTISFEETSFEPRNTLEYDGIYYRIMDYAPESLALLHQAGFRLFYISGGEVDRNQFIINEIYRRVNEYKSRRITPRETSDYRPLLIAGRENLRKIDATSEQAKFTDRYKKDLFLFEKLDLKDLFFVDDHLDFAMAGQAQHFIWIDNSYYDILDFHKIPPERKAQPYMPSSYSEWILERHSILIVTEALLQSLEQQSARLTYYEMAKSLLFDSNAGHATSSGVASQKLMKDGLNRLHVAASLQTDAKGDQVRSYPNWKSQENRNRCKRALLSHFGI